MIIAELTLTCSGLDRTGNPTHGRTVIAALAIDDHLGIVLKPTAQQRGNPQAGRPRPFGELLGCQICGFRVPAGRPPHKGLRRVMMKYRDARVPELSLHDLRDRLDRHAR
jgi:hypothetical protein